MVIVRVHLPRHIWPEGCETFYICPVLSSLVLLWDCFSFIYLLFQIRSWKCSKGARLTVIDDAGMGCGEMKACRVQARYEEPMQSKHAAKNHHDPSTLQV